MNTDLAMKLNLLNYIKSFSMPDFPHLKVLSKTFFHDLCLDFYKNDDVYTMLYGDIDGLRKLNDRVGFEQADNAIEELLKTILKYLPQDTISSKVGGDEFCFIIPNLDTEQTRVLTKQIHNSLKSNEKVLGLDITFGACDSRKFNNNFKMYNFIENKVSSKKNAHLKLTKNAKDINDYNNKLDKVIDSTIKTYINNFRFSESKVFTKEDLQILSYPILDTVTNLLNKDIETSKSSRKTTSSEKELNIDVDIAQKLYSLVLNDEIDYTALNDISTSDLRIIRNDLSIDPITGAYNKIYKEHYLLPRLEHYEEDKDSTFDVILLESLGVKMSNSIYSHTGTDEKIRYTYNNLMDKLQNLITYNDSIKITPIHIGGGTFEIFIENNDGSINGSSLEEIITQINSNPENLELFGEMSTCENTFEYPNVLSYLHGICDDKKNTIKNSYGYFISPNALKLLEVSLTSTVSFFKNQSQNLGTYDEQEKIKFTQKILNTLIDNFSRLNLSNKENSLDDNIR